MTPSVTLVYLLSMLILVGCTTGSDIGPRLGRFRLHRGLTLREVTEAVGQPLRTTRIGDQAYYCYRLNDGRELRLRFGAHERGLADAVITNEDAQGKVNYQKRIFWTGRAEASGVTLGCAPTTRPAYRLDQFTLASDITLAKVQRDVGPPSDAPRSDLPGFYYYTLEGGGSLELYFDPATGRLDRARLVGYGEGKTINFARTIFWQGEDDPDGDAPPATQPVYRLEQFRLKRGMKIDQVRSDVGRPTFKTGSGVLQYMYRLTDGRELRLFSSDSETIDSAELVRRDASGAETEVLELIPAATTAPTE